MDYYRIIVRILLAGLLLAVAAVAMFPHSAHGGAPTATESRAEALWLEGAGLHVEGRYRSAIERFQAALALHPSGRTHTWLAWSLSRQGQLERAVDHCRASIRIDPAYPNAYNDIGSYLVDLDRPREAERWLRKALESDDYCCPHYAWYHLARALLLQGRPAAAMDAVEQSLERRGNYRPAIRLLLWLRARDLRAA